MDADTLHQLARTAPTPLARLAARAQNESAPERQHHNSYYVFELWLRMHTAVAVARYRERQVRVSSIEESLPSLLQPAAGTLLAFLTRYGQHFDDTALGTLFALPIDADMAPGYRWASEHSGGVAKATPTHADFAWALVGYRNKIIGHGALHARTFYRDGAARLFRAIGRLVDRSASAGAGHFVAAEEVMDDGDAPTSILLDLVGSLQARRTEPLVGTRAGDIVHGAVFFEEPGRSAVALSPWLVWDDTFVQVMSSVTKTKLDYLNYYTGEVVSRPFTAALRAFLGTTGESLPDRGDGRRRVGDWMGDYELISVLGRGGMGTVYRARQESTEMPVALKALPMQFSTDAAAVGRFRREVSILKRCAHRHIVSVLDAGEANGQHYFVMELVRGCTLGELYGVLANVPRDSRSRLTSSHLHATLRRLVGERSSSTSSEPQPDEDVQVVSQRNLAAAREVVSDVEVSGEELWRVLLLRFAEVAEALGHLHDRGVIHRDVKPSNIMLTEDGTRAVVMDLGVAKTSTGSVHTKTGSFVGTLRYASREQAVRSLELTSRSDLYSLGATMYELFTLTPLYAEDEAAASSTPDGALLKQILDDRPVPARERNPALKPEISIILEKLLEKQPERRFYSSAAMLAEDLRNVYHQRPIRAHDYTRDERRAFELFDSLQAQATTWTSEQRPTDLLWGEERSEEMERLGLRGTFEFTPAQADFYAATVDHARELRRVREAREEAERGVQEELRLERARALEASRRVRRGLIAAGFIVLIAFSASITFVFFRVQRERDVSRASEAALRQAHDRLLASEAEGYVVKARQAEREARWDEAILYAAFARKLGASQATPGESDAAGSAFAREGSLPVAPRLRWSKRMEGSARDVSLSPDRQWLAVATDRGTVVIASATDGSVKTALQLGDGRAEPVHAASVAFSPEKPILAAALDDGSVALWDTETWTARPALRTASRAAIAGIAFSGDGTILAAGGDDGVLRVWGLPGGTLVYAQDPPHGPAALSAVAVAFDGRLVVGGYEDGSIRFVRRGSDRWSTSQIVQPHSGRAFALGFVGRSRSLLSASDDETIGVWEPDESGRFPSEPRRLREHGKDAYAITTSRDGALVASGGADNAVRLWRPSTWGQIRVLAHYPDEVLGLSLSADGTTLATALEDGTVEVRDIVDRERALGERERSPLLSHDAPVEGLAFSDDGSLLLSSGEDANIRIWRPREGRLEGQLRVDGVRWVLDASGDLRTAVTGDRSGTLRVWDVATRRTVSERSTLGLELLTVAFSPDQRLVAFGTLTGIVGLWRRDDDALFLWKGHHDTANTVQFSRDGRWLASVGGDPSVRVWDVAERLARERPTPAIYDDAAPVFRGTDGRTDDVTFSPDGSLLATASRDGIVRVWNAQTRELVHSYHGHTDRVYGVAFSPDGHMLASCSKDGSIRVTDLTTHAERVLLGHVGAVNAVRFSRAGARLASAGADRTVRLWDTKTWTEIGATVPSASDMELDAVEARTGLCLVGGEAAYARAACPRSNREAE